MREGKPMAKPRDTDIWDSPERVDSTKEEERGLVFPLFFVGINAPRGEGVKAYE